MNGDPRRHAAWIRLANWRDSTEPGTGHRTSNLGKSADFSATVRERMSGGDWRHPARSFDWELNRQRTEREGPDDRGRHWETRLGSGSEPTMAKAKAAAMAALRTARMTHILTGGDVGYGDAPSGQQIRESIASRRALAPGQSMVMASGEHDGVAWEHRLSRPAGTIGLTESYRLWCGDSAIETLTSGGSPEQAAAAFKADVDARPRRRQAAEQAQQQEIAESVRVMLGTEREHARLNPLAYTEVLDAYKAAHGAVPPRSLTQRWARFGVTQAEHDSAWYQNALEGKQTRASRTPEQLRARACREMAAGLAYEATETAHQARLADPKCQDLMRQGDERRLAGERNARAQAHQIALAQAQGST